MENISMQQRNKMAIISGIMLGIVYIILTTLTYKSVGNLITFYVVKSVGYIIYLVLLGIFVARIKKANGGLSRV